MKKPLPTLTYDSAPLFGLPHEALKWELLKTAIELKVFDHLSSPTTAEAVSGELSLHPGNTEYLPEWVGRAGLSDQGGRSLPEHATGGPVLDDWQGDVDRREPAVHGQVGCAAVGRRAVDAGPRGPAGAARTWPTMKSGGKAPVRASTTADAAGPSGSPSTFPSCPGSLPSRRCWYLGAGPGIIGIAVAAAHPSLECVLFDQPAVCEVADEVIAEYGMEDRVSTRAGSYVTDEIGDGYDLVMAHFTLNFYRDKPRPDLPQDSRLAQARRRVLGGFRRPQRGRHGACHERHQLAVDHADGRGRLVPDRAGRGGHGPGGPLWPRGDRRSPSCRPRPTVRSS